MSVYLSVRLNFIDLKAQYRCKKTMLLAAGFGLITQLVVVKYLNVKYDIRRHSRKILKKKSG